MIHTHLSQFWLHIFWGEGEQHGTDSLFNLEFAHEDRQLVCLRCFRFRYLCLWPKLEFVLNSE